MSLICHPGGYDGEIKEREERASTRDSTRICTYDAEARE